MKQFFILIFFSFLFLLIPMNVIAQLINVSSFCFPLFLVSQVCPSHRAADWTTR